MWRPGGNDLPAIDERVELRVVASRFLPEVVTLSIWGIMVRLLAGGQDLPWVSQFPDRFHACISVHCRVPCVPHNGLVYFGAAARPSFEQCGPERKRERESSVYTSNRPFFDLTFRRITISYRIFYCDRYLLERFAFNDLTKKGIRWNFLFQEILCEY